MSRYVTRDIFRFKRPENDWGKFDEILILYDVL